MSILEDIAYAKKHLLQGSDRYMEELYEMAVVSFSDCINLNTRPLVKEERRGCRHKYSNEIYHLHYKALIHRALSYQKLKLYDKAIIDVKEAVEILESEMQQVKTYKNTQFTKHDILFCYRTTGFIHYDVKNYNVAIIAFRKALQFLHDSEQDSEMSAYIDETNGTTMYSSSYYQEQINVWTMEEMELVNVNENGEGGVSVNIKEEIF